MNDFSNEKLLVIAPHSDDEILGCGGLISKI
jgi:LmbE family N-acetylglucosaminyl deacetylase